jgi:hypothetical protein
MDNYKTHSIKHKCFPPKPSECIICGKTGDALWKEPCIHVDVEPTTETKPLDMGPEGPWIGQD